MHSHSQDLLPLLVAMSVRTQADIAVLHNLVSVLTEAVVQNLPTNTAESIDPAAQKRAEGIRFALDTVCQPQAGRFYRDAELENVADLFPESAVSIREYVELGDREFRSVLGKLALNYVREQKADHEESAQ